MATLLPAVKGFKLKGFSLTVFNTLNENHNKIYKLNKKRNMHVFKNENYAFI